MTPRTSLTLLDRLKDPANLQDWELFVSLYQPLITRQLVRYDIDQHDAEDLSQDVLVVTYRALPEFEHNGRVGAFRTWLRSIIHHRALNHLRTRGRNPVTSSDLGADWQNVSQTQDADKLWEEEHDQYVLQRLMSLIESEFTKSTWLAFHHQAIGGRTPHQAADELGLTVNAVMIAKSRVLARLRSLCIGLIDDELL